MSDEKPVQRADRLAAKRTAATDVAARRWWRLLPRLLFDPVPVFRALRESDEDDVVARQEPLLAIIVLAGMAGALITPTWGHLLDDRSIDGLLIVLVLTFIGGGLAGAVVYFVLGLALGIGIRGAGSLEPFRLARQTAGFAALPIAVSLLITAPVALIGFGSDFFRSGGRDAGAGHAVVVGIGLAFVAWSVGLLALGLRTTLRLPWRGVATAIALGGVTIAFLVALPWIF